MKPTISAEIFEDTSSAQIAIFDGEAAVSRLSLDADSLLALIQQLGDVHKLLTANKPIPAIEGQTIQAVFNTRWYIHTEMVGEAAALSFYHPAYGPVGFVVPIDQVNQMVEILSLALQQSDESRNSPQ